MTTTSFIHTRVDVGHGLTVVIDGNSKITAGNGTFQDPRPNAFSLPAASVSGRETCPGSTPTCRASCYVRGLSRNAPEVYAAYTENATALRVILDTTSHYHDEVFHDTATELGAWITEHAAGGFRWHVSGDVWNFDHAMWIRAVCLMSPDARHWIYTRTLDVVEVLVDAPNLAVNVSADRDNYNEAEAVARRHGARLCYMATDELDARLGAIVLRDGDIVFPDYPLRGRGLPDPTSHPYWRHASHRLKVMTCPADYFGQSEQHRCGPCAKCLVK